MEKLKIFYMCSRWRSFDISKIINGKDDESIRIRIILSS